MTDIFLYIVFASIIVFDIVLAIRRKPTVSDFFRRWYETFIFVPYTVGFLFLGHFINIIPSKVNVVAIILFSLPVLVISIIFSALNIKIKRKWIIFIPVIVGYLVGDLFF